MIQDHDGDSTDVSDVAETDESSPCGVMWDPQGMQHDETAEDHHRDVVLTGGNSGAI